MRRYILKRVLQTIPLLVGISLLTFVLLQLTPGDFLNQMAENPGIAPEAIDAMRRRFGLDQPWYIQYALYLQNLVLHFDFGESFSRHQPVFTVLREGLGNTLLLAVASAVVTWGLAVPLGIWAAVRQHSWVDRLLSLIAFVWLSIPEILSGLLLLMLAARTGWFPVGGMRSLDYDDLTAWGQFLDLAHHLALPALVVGLIPLASRMRQMRSNLLDVLRLDYVTTARAKGLDERVVVFKHALRGGVQPVVAFLAPATANLLTGSFVVETIFQVPGLGREFVEAAFNRDYTMIIGTVLVYAFLVMALNLVADVVQALLDPRVRQGHAHG